MIAPRANHLARDVDLSINFLKNFVDVPIMCPVDWPTFFVSIAGICFGIYYFALIHEMLSAFEKIFEKTLKKLNKIKTLKNNQLEIILKDYEITNKEIERRENITLIVGSIMLTSSFIILGRSISESEVNTRWLAALASLSLYIIWLYGLHYTSRAIDNMTYPRIRAIEKRLDQEVGNYGFGVHSFLFNELYKKEKIEKKFKFRKIFWGITLFILSLAWFLAAFFPI